MNRIGYIAWTSLEKSKLIALIFRKDIEMRMWALIFLFFFFG